MLQGEVSQRLLSLNSFMYVTEVGPLSSTDCGPLTVLFDDLVRRPLTPTQPRQTDGRLLLQPLHGTRRARPTPEAPARGRARAQHADQHRYAATRKQLLAAALRGGHVGQHRHNLHAKILDRGHVFSNKLYCLFFVSTIRLLCVETFDWLIKQTSSVFHSPTSFNTQGRFE